jgi:hypothetical protein
MKRRSYGELAPAAMRRRFPDCEGVYWWVPDDGWANVKLFRIPVAVARDGRILIPAIEDHRGLDRMGLRWKPLWSVHRGKRTRRTVWNLGGRFLGKIPDPDLRPWASMPWGKEQKCQP